MTPFSSRVVGKLLVMLMLGVTTAPLQAADVPPVDPMEQPTYDPLEGMNRAIYSFNKSFDRWLLKPVARGYDFITPKPVQLGVRRFFSNLWSPTVVINDVLQGKLRQSVGDTSRFVVNSTIGIVGLFDVADKWGLPPHDEDFGQTLAVWGVHEGPYLVLPIIGPRNARDSVGILGDWFTHPVRYLNDTTTQWILWGVQTVDTRAKLLGASDVLNQAAGQDEYLFVREAYRQRRYNLIYDGNPPKPKFFDDDAIIEPPSTAPAAQPTEPLVTQPAEPSTTQPEAPLAEQPATHSPPPPTAELTPTAH
jgi:phospholipid-binding lipoprotein MlaA